jgi:Ca2+-binding EF-hand superfamily protein
LSGKTIPAEKLIQLLQAGHGESRPIGFPMFVQIVSDESKKFERVKKILLDFCHFLDQNNCGYVDMKEFQHHAQLSDRQVIY